jgi:hypothetical protein
MLKTPSICAITLATCLTVSASAGEKLACELHALDARERARHAELTKVLLREVAETVELAEGYAFRPDRASYALAAEWIALESRCCPFFSFELALARNRGPLWLRLSGSPGVKAFIKSELALSR